MMQHSVVLPPLQIFGHPNQNRQRHCAMQDLAFSNTPVYLCTQQYMHVGTNMYSRSLCWFFATISCRANLYSHTSKYTNGPAAPQSWLQPYKLGHALLKKRRHIRQPTCGGNCMF
eukprot:scpid108097/ scgid29373/ 